jgi:DNA-binding transcriptional ArsR family regulator
MRRDAFQAIADPNRRAILALLATQKLTLNGVAGKFAISRPAISRHMKILAECGLVEMERKGRERYCQVRLRKLDEVAHWVDQYRRFWEEKLDALEAYLNNVNARRPTTSKPKGRPR